MASSSNIGPVSQQYAAAATVPLIKSPSLWLPKPIELPNDIHPLPEDITAYFVYPFALESHVLSLQPTPHDAIAERRARNAAILLQREQEEEQRERAALHRMAPGYHPSGLLVPLSASPAAAPAPPPSSISAQAATPAAQPVKVSSLMDDLESLSFAEPEPEPAAGNDATRTAILFITMLCVTSLKAHTEIAAPVKRPYQAACRGKGRRLRLAGGEA
ncbi:uncharacterized protein MKK02DRAFT_41783 [Dioszegia hungarica]|uniref:Uncharacterized protein n=1 Tax=Dioszegia hungarica TaxID=4972 RepID=A0AA38LWH3_9TREE|nr:uncharacterized protein MKK02DRAFT_41783 [Dioszegia hungarica]KAI9638757.1 hypothetical protein MKK02DRAFT_41783 [Dioszegia hungarica]